VGLTRREIRRAELLDAALRVIRRGGSGRVAMEDIAVEAGISRPILYRQLRRRHGALRRGGRRLLPGAAVPAAALGPGRAAGP
jgi:AcrR family transcriptional regulator